MEFNFLSQNQVIGISFAYFVLVGLLLYWKSK